MDIEVIGCFIWKSLCLTLVSETKPLGEECFPECTLSKHSFILVCDPFVPMVQRNVLDSP